MSNLIKPDGSPLVKDTNNTKIQNLGIADNPSLEEYLAIKDCHINMMSNMRFDYKAGKFVTDIEFSFPVALPSAYFGVLLKKYIEDEDTKKLWLDKYNELVEITKRNDLIENDIDEKRRRDDAKPKRKLFRGSIDSDDVLEKDV